MPVFEYQALSQSGKNSKGVIEADSERHVRQLLREKKILLTEIKVLKKKADTRSSGGGKKTVFSSTLSMRDKVIVTRQLANLIRASLPVEEALRTIAEHNNNAIKRFLSPARSRIIEGASLQQALQEQNVFDTEYTATIAAGEKSGELALVLEKLADDIERKDKFRRTITSAMVYPMLILFVSIAVVVALLTFVVPQVVEVFVNTNRQLPELTIAMIALSDFLREKGQWLGLSIAGIFLVFNLALRKKELRYKWHRVLMRLPLVGKIFLGSNTAQFARNFSLMQSSGVSVLEALRSSAQTLSCLPMSEAILKAVEDIREGSSIYRALERYNALPPMALYMLASGEASGNIPDMLNRAAINQEHELEAFTSSLLSILEPVIILFMGGMVLTIVLSILLPIFELNSAIV